MGIRAGAVVNAPVSGNPNQHCSGTFASFPASKARMVSRPAFGLGLLLTGRLAKKSQKAVESALGASYHWATWVISRPGRRTSGGTRVETPGSQSRGERGSIRNDDRAVGYQG